MALSEYRDFHTPFIAKYQRVKVEKFPTEQTQVSGPATETGLVCDNTYKLEQLKKRDRSGKVKKLESSYMHRILCSRTSYL